MLSPKIIKLKDILLNSGKNPKFSHFDFDYNYAGCNLYKENELWEKCARSMAYAISNQNVWVDSNDTIGGRIFYSNEKKVEEYCHELEFINYGYKKIKEEILDYDELRNNQIISDILMGHITWRFDYILEYGIQGLKEKYQKALNETDDNKSKEFYQGVLIMFDALLEFNDKHIEYYEKLENYELAERMKKVPRYPCSSFKEAVQSFYMQHIVVMRENPYGGNGPGRLDYFLWPYLRKDLEKGIITIEEAKEIIDELFLRFEERLYDMDMWTESIVVGGTNEDGSSSVNPLTYIMIESIIDLKIIHPSVYIRMPINQPEELVNICAKYVLIGNNRAQILNDESIISALQNNGVSYKDAVQYTCGGCMEIGIQGKQSDLMYAGWQNTLKILELMITGGVCLKTKNQQSFFKNKNSLSKYNSFDAFYEDFIKEANRLTKIFLRQFDIYSRVLEERRPSYLLSSMIDDCFKKGRNMHGGGAKYHDYGGTHLGLPNLIDSLYAIKVGIFENKICTKESLIDALINNYSRYEKLQYELKKLPKYGIDDAEVDKFANKVMSDFLDMYLNYKTRFNGRGKPTILTFIHSPAAASILGATADGLNAGHSIAQGITPYSNSMKNGITAAINSCCKMPYMKFYGGASSMWDFASSWINENIVKAILLSFISQKGQIFQGNTTPVNELINAKIHPEKYENLMVRVGGYSAKFVNLWPELQDEVINRLRHRG